MSTALDNKQKAPTLIWAAVLDESVADLDWSNSDRLFAACVDGNLSAYDLEGELLFRKQLHSEAITRVSVQKNGSHIGSCGEDGQVLVSDAVSGEQLETLINGTKWVELISWSPDDQSLACAVGKEVYVRDVNSQVETWDGHPGVVGALAWAPNGKRLASGTNKGVYLWNLGTWDPLKVLEFPGAAISLAWSENGRALAAGTQDGFMHVRLQMPGATPRQLSMSGYPGKVNYLQWNPALNSKQYCIATSGGKDVVLWYLNIKTGDRKAVPLYQHDHTVTALSWSADGSYLVAGDRAGRVCFWDSKGEFIFDMELGTEITVLSWHPSKTLLAVGNIDGTLRLFSMEQNIEN